MSGGDRREEGISAVDRRPAESRKPDSMTRRRRAVELIARAVLRRIRQEQQDGVDGVPDGDAELPLAANPTPHNRTKEPT